MDSDHPLSAPSGDSFDLLSVLRRRLRRLKRMIREQGYRTEHWLAEFRRLAGRLAEARADRRSESGDDA